MSDLTLVYYTANRIDHGFAFAIRLDLLTRTLTQSPYPVIVVSQRDVVQPKFWNQQIVVGDIGATVYNVYRQVLIGAKAATTPYVACCEDDTLYVPDHFTHRPPLDTFAYNENRLVISRRQSSDGKRREAFYYYRTRTQMAMCIAPRELLIETLEEKFAKYPIPPASTDIAKKAGWGEPGRYEKNLGLTPRKMERFHWTEWPNVTFNHESSLMGRRQVKETDVIYTDVEPWGNADALWNRIHG